jgi:hypothetical protein
VQENCIDLVGRIADRGAEYVPAREWMRICFELLDMLKAHKKAIRRATVNTFGYIAKAIGPQDVLVTLLNNLKVQERQNRVCTTVAIAIVAETCAPFTVLPALMNEYRVPELNVQNGVLKALSFMFEYIGEMGKDYIYAVTPLLQVRCCPCRGAQVPIQRAWAACMHRPASRWTELMQLMYVPGCHWAASAAEAKRSVIVVAVVVVVVVVVYRMRWLTGTWCTGKLQLQWCNTWRWGCPAWAVRTP